MVGTEGPQRIAVLPGALVLAVLGSVIFLAVVLHGSAQAMSPFYYLVMTLLGWAVFRRARVGRAEAWLQGLPGPAVLRAVGLGYAAVVFEETLVGTFFALNEGITAQVWMERVWQFIAFNLLAFSGAIWGMAVMLRRWPALRAWHLPIAGAWGLFAERSYLIFLENPIAGALIAAPNIAVYSIILAPLTLSLPAAEGDARPVWWRAVVIWAVMFALSVPFVAALLGLRGGFPAVFPSCDYISCL